MATVNEACSEIIDAVNSSGLDFSLNLTPYSVHFSIRRKFSKISSSRNNRLLKIDTSQNDSLRRELLHMRSEYEKLYNFCQFETKQKSVLEAELLKETNVKGELQVELSKVYHQLNLSTNDENQTKKLVNENSALKDTLNNKCIEIKQLKNQLEEIKKEKNVLSVALKGKNQEIKEINKAIANEKEVLEKKVFDLNEYKARKMTEEREERIKIKKEIKKEKQKSRKLVNHGQNDANSNIPNPEVTEVKQNEVKTDKLETEKNMEGFPRHKNYDETDDSIKGVEENEAPEEDLDDENVNLMTDKDFIEHMWKNFCGKPRPAKYTSQQESVKDKLKVGRDLDDR
jgi:hypothetical protein